MGASIWSRFVLAELPTGPAQYLANRAQDFPTLPAPGLEVALFGLDSGLHPTVLEGFIHSCHLLSIL